MMAMRDWEDGAVPQAERETSLTIGILTILPDFFSVLREHGVTARALQKKIWKCTIFNPREFSGNNYQSVDDRPYGGGAGMVMRYEPLKKSHEKLTALSEFKEAFTIYLSPKGIPVTQQRLRNTLKTQRPLIFICGRYEGIDQRVINAIVDEEWSIGDYILSGGELAAMVCIDALVREIPGVLGNQCSSQEESFSTGLLECPHYTRPREIDGLPVPDVLLSGHHDQIQRWRRQQALGETWRKRPELLARQDLSVEDDCLLQAFKVEYLESQSQKFVHS